MTPAEQLKEAVLDLQSKLLSAHPQMPTLLQTIHKQLRADPALETTLSDEDVSIIVAGLSKIQMTTIATAVAKTGTKAMAKMTVADL